MKTYILILILITILSVIKCENFENSYRYPCIRAKQKGFCVPQKTCCGCDKSDGFQYRCNWHKDKRDQGNCTRNEFCCTQGSIDCQSCDEGTRKVNETCLDINECAENYGLCSGHKCINYYGNYTCECFDSYEMIGNTKTCKHLNESETADLLFSASRTINLIQLNENNKSRENIKMIYSGTVTPYCMDYSFDGNYLAWTDTTLNQINIAPINDRHSSLVRDRITLRFIKNPTSLAIDWIHNLLYWLDLGTRTINVANIFTPDNYYAVINVTEQEPHDLVVNVLDYMLVWNHVGLKPRIMRSFQDGTNQSVLYSTHKQTFCITIDVFLKRYYFIDIEDFSLYSINFEGKDEKQIYHSREIINNIISLNIYYDDIFMSTNDLVFKMNKFAHFDALKGQKAEALVKSLTFSDNKAFIIDDVTESHRKQIYNVKILDPILQPQLPNRCQFAKCSHICLPSNRDRIFRCLCPKNMVLVNFTDCTESRFQALVWDSLNWESDLQKLIDHSISKSINLRKLLNQSFTEQIDLRNLFNKSFVETIEMRKLFDFTSIQSIEMKKSFIKALNETLFWKKILNSTFYNRKELEILLNESLMTNNFSGVVEFMNNLTKTDSYVDVSDVMNSRTGEQVILSLILMAIFAIIIIFIIIGFKLKLFKFKKKSYSTSPLYRKSHDINSIEMESKT